MSKTKTKNDKGNKLAHKIPLICKMIIAFDLPNSSDHIKLVEAALEDREKDFYAWIEQQPDSTTDIVESYADEYQFIKSSRETIRTWLFVACYSRFEDALITICKHMEKSNLDSPLPKGNLDVKKAGKYLIEKGFAFLTNDEDWRNLSEGYRLARNLIVHNRGRLDQFYWKRKPEDAKASKGFIDTTPTIIFEKLEQEEPEFGTIHLTESFCQDFIGTERRFFQVLLSEAKKLLDDA